MKPIKITTTDDDYWRFLKWLGQRSHARKLLRTVAPLLKRHDESLPLIDQWLALVAPWTVREYPRRFDILKAICGRSESGGMLTKWRREGLPWRTAERLAAFLESRVVREQGLIERLRERAAREKVREGYYFSVVTTDERAVIKQRGLAMRRRRAAERKARGAKLECGFASMPAARLAELSRRGVASRVARQLEKASSGGEEIPARESVRSVPDKKGDSD